MKYTRVTLSFLCSVLTPTYAKTEDDQAFAVIMVKCCIAFHQSTVDAMCNHCLGESDRRALTIVDVTIILLGS